MAEELAYALITPHSIRKSRTGAILTRMLSRLSHQLIALQIIAPTSEMAAAYADSIRKSDNPEDESYRHLIRDYIRSRFSPDPITGLRQRTLMLVFRGENVHQDLSRITGSLRISSDQGRTIRDAFGDLVTDNKGKVYYFEPAVILSDSQEDFKIWLDFLKTQPTLLNKICTYPEYPSEEIERTLVIIKPDSWRRGSARPGTILDFFSRTGLRVVGCKLNYMSIKQAQDFYAPVKDKLYSNLPPEFGKKAREVLQKEFDLSLSDKIEEELAGCVGLAYARQQFDKLIEYMTGRNPAFCTAAEMEQPGTSPSLALVYEGPGAVNKIREVLGPTNPRQAPDGTVRREFGIDIMINTAHASDSSKNASREMNIIKMDQPHLLPAVENYLN